MTPIDRILFFGTPEFAVPSLDALVAAGRPPLRVITQPPRRAGRGKKIQQPPVALRAESLGLPLMQAPKVKAVPFLDDLERLRPDLAVVIAFGQIFPRRLLELPAHGCVNVHASLLPAYRGAAPIQAALAAGDALTGVCTMVMERGLDTGPVLLRESMPILADDTGESLSRRLAALGAKALIDTIEALEQGSAVPTPQDDALASYAPRIEKADGRIDWTLSAGELDRRLRAFTPWPGFHTSLGERALKVIAATPIDVTSIDGVSGDSLLDASGDSPLSGTHQPGTYLGLVGARMAVVCGDGSILGLESVQRPGRNQLTAIQFIHGERLRAGQRLG